MRVKLTWYYLQSRDTDKNVRTFESAEEYALFMVAHYNKISIVDMQIM